MIKVFPHLLRQSFALCHSDMIFLAIFVALFLSVCLYFHEKHQYFKKRGIPFAPGYFPLGSSLIWKCFQGKEAYLKVADHYYDQFPNTKVFGYFEPFGEPVLVIKDLDLAKKIMVKDFDHFVDRKFILPNPKGNKLASQILLCLQGEAWKKTRHLLSPLFTASKLKSIMPLIHDCAIDLNKHLDNVLLDQVDCKDVFQRFTIEILGNLGCGIKPGVLTQDKNVFYEMAMLLTGSKMPKLKAALNMAIHIFLPRIAFYFNLKVVEQEHLDFFTNIVKTSLETRDNLKTKRNDFIDLLKDAIHENGNRSKRGLEDFVMANALMLFFVGNDTSSGALALSLHNLAKYPTMQEKLYREIQEAIEENNGNIFLDYETLSKLSFMGKFIRETIRLWGINFFDRTCTKDYFIEELNLRIPKGMHVTIAGGKLMTDEANFDDPLTFDPEKNFASNQINPPNFLGFGQGPRNCIGMKLAYTIVGIGLVHVLNKYQVVKGPKTKDRWDLNPIVPGGIGLGEIFVQLKLRN